MGTRMNIDRVNLKSNRKYKQLTIQTGIRRKIVTRILNSIQKISHNYDLSIYNFFVYFDKSL